MIEQISHGRDLFLLTPINRIASYSSSIDPIRFSTLAFRRRSSNPSTTLSSLGLLTHRSLKPQIRVFSSRNDPPGHAEPAIGDAQAAVVELMREFGASVEDALDISEKSPKYLEMIVDSVRELDEHGLWSSWDLDMVEDIGSLGFREKVYLMALKKGDGGVVPLLESVGLKLSSAMFISRYLSSQKLPDLIWKVKFMKGMLFTGTGQEKIIGRNARRMMMRLSIPIDDDIQRTLSYYEKVEAKRGGLDMIGYETTFSCIIESFPSLLSRVTEENLVTLVDFLESVGVPKSGIHIILLLFPPILFYDMERDIKPRVCALEKAGVKDLDIGRLLVKYPWILSTSIQDNYEKILAFFNAEKVEKSAVYLAIKSWPHLLGCSTHKMKSVVEQFGELGVSKKMITPVITSSPQLLLKKPNELLEVISFMEEVGLDDKTIGRILCRCPEIFGANIDSTLKKKLKFLTEFGIPSDGLPRVIRKYPEFLGLDVLKTLLPRIRYLMEIGLSKREVCSMIVRFSPLLGYGIEAVMKPKLEFLLRTMEKPLVEVVQYPRYFSYSLEKRIKPRFWVLKSRNISCSLKEMLGKNNEEFAEAYMGLERMLVYPSSLPPDEGG